MHDLCRLFQQKTLAPPRVGKIDAFKHEREFGKRHRRRRAAIVLLRNLERPGFQALVVQAVAAAIPEQDLDPVTIAVEENKKMAGQRILPDDRFRQKGKTVKTLAQIGRLQADEHLHR